jgi:hypothetical protein
MKKILKTVSIVSIILFFVSWILCQFNLLNEFNSSDFTIFFAIIYLFVSLKYFQIEVKDKNAEIQDLKFELKKAKGEYSKKAE